ncbi:fibronectin type III domain-containing protein [Geotalea uraniireducens]|uniref:Fibronectin, type III domain protein n=1 Tax=Geotalea uraniireducens (strain Rf4) TaxID=351605 RepID=A5GFK7_GEOUR|nr:fibronectin type III domain-containing protein [Geotalea uraniireducens]ABQ26212.1 Fibronectin, type III domain protein [Geotalea uraniireducens Rf4]
MREQIKRTFAGITVLCLVAVGLMLTGCGSSGGGLSSQVVSGVAAVGAPLAGQVNLKDASNPPQEKSTVIGNDGTFAFDVTGMKGPFILQASGRANGTNYALHSFAGGTGTANVNPLSNAAVASAAGVDDPSQVFANPDPVTLQKIESNLQTAVATILSKLHPLLKQYSADNSDPIKGHYTVDHTGLDGMLDNVKMTLSNGVLTIVNAKTGAVIFSGKISDINNWNFSDDDNNIPAPPAVPAAPAGLTATGAAGQMTLSWNAVSNATSYNVYYSTTGGVSAANGTKIAGATSPYVQSGLTAGTTYYYIVTAVNSAGESAASAQVSATTNATPTPTPTLPAAPTGVMATGGTNQVTLSWSAVSNAASYNIYWSTKTGVTTSNGTKISGAMSPAVQAGLAAGTTYYYIVTAVNSAGESTPSVQVAATTVTPTPAPTVPAAPSGVTATGGAKQVTLSWPAVSGATSYNVYWSTASGVTTANGTRIAGATSPYVHTGLSAGTSYYYIVTAVNGAGESAPSTQATATTNAPLPAVPAAPTGVTATGGANQVSLSWSAVSGATSYNVYWSTTSGVTTASGTKIAGATSPYVQTGLAAGTAYYYIVTAVNSAGESAASAKTTATTAAPAIDGAALYSQYCAGCHGALASSNKRKTTASKIQSGISGNVGGMGYLSSLSAAQIQAIATALNF